MCLQAASRWKKYETDAFGNVVKVTEPNPQGGARAAGNMVDTSDRQHG